MSILTVASADAIELGRKLDNTLAMCRGTMHKVEILVGSERGHADVLAIAACYASEGVRVVPLASDLGPLTAWAQLAHAARYEVVLFADVAARMAPETLDALLAPMRDAQVGMTVPRYVPCFDDGDGLRARLEAARSGLTAACYAGLAVRRRLLRRPAHDTVLPGLVSALHVLGRGLRVANVPQVRVFHREAHSARARFSRIAQRTHGHLQATLRHPEDLLGRRNGVRLAMLREGLTYVPALLAWLVSALMLAVCDRGIVALLVVAAGALCIVVANRTRRGVPSRSWLDRVGAWLTTGAAQTYGAVRASRQASGT